MPTPKTSGISKTIKQNRYPIIFLSSLFVVLILVVTLIPWQPSPEAAVSPEEEGEYLFDATVEISFATFNAADNEEIDANVSIFEKNIKGLTTDQVEDLDFSNYTLKKSGRADSVTFRIAKDYAYLIKTSATDFHAEWMKFDNGTITFTDSVPIVQLGKNYIYLVNKSESVSFLGFSMEGYNTTFNMTDHRDWNVNYFVDDDDRGFAKEFNTTLGDYDYLAVIINTTVSTASASFASIYPTQTVSVASGSEIFFFLDGFFWDDGSFEIHMSSKLTVDYNVTSMTVAFGSPSDLDNIHRYSAQY